MQFDNQTDPIRKGNTIDLNIQSNVAHNSSLTGVNADNNMFRSHQPQKSQIPSQNHLQRVDNEKENRISFNELIQEKKKLQERADQEQLDEDAFILNEKFSSKISQISYGSSITISVAEFPSCYIYSDGFSSKTIKLKEFKSAQGSRELDFFNTVFMVLPQMEYKYQEQLLDQFVNPESNMKFGKEELSKRKQKIQTLQQNIDGEFSANTLLFNKLKGTPVLFTTSSFHLVHKASLKYLSVDDTNEDSYNFKFVDFPDQNCLFKFLPCLMFQKQRSNTIYNKDNLFIVSSKQIHNRKPYIFTEYSGQTGINKIDVLSEEQSFGKIYANLETQCKWKINLFQESESEEEIRYTMNVGDSIWINLSEHHFTISAIKSTNIQQKIKNNIYSVNDPQSNVMNSGISDSNIQRNKSRNKSLISNQSPKTNGYQNTQNNFNFAISPINANMSNNQIQTDRTYQNQTSLHGKQFAKQITLGQEFLTPHYQKQNTQKGEEQNQMYQSVVSRKLSGLTNSHDFDDEDDYDENLDANIGQLENDIIHSADVDFIPTNADDDENFTKKEDYQKIKSSTSGYRDEGFQSEDGQIQKDENLQEEDDENTKDNSRSLNLNTQGLWKIESEYFVVGGFLEWKLNYRLRHFATGKYLTLEQTKNGNYNMKLTETPTNQSLFQFEGPSQIDMSKQKYITKDSFYRLKHVNSNNYIGIDQRKFQSENKCVMRVSSEQNQYNIYKIKKANFDDTWETNFLLCCVPILTESIKFINRIGQKSVLEKFMKNRQAFEQIFSKIKQVLQDIDSFISNTLTSNISVTEEYGKPSLVRSNILREQHVLGILCLLLFKAYPKEEAMKNISSDQILERAENEQNKMFLHSFITNQYSPSENGGYRSPLTKMMDDVSLKRCSISIQIYKIFQNVCFDNKQNQEYLFKFMSEFQKQIGRRNDIVCESLIRFFKSNKSIIQRLSLPVQIRKSQKKLSRAIAPQQQGQSPTNQRIGSHISVGDEKATYINLIINKLSDYSQQKKRKSDILKLLTQFCKYYDQAIFHNQEMIFSDLILKNKNNITASPLFNLVLDEGENLIIVVNHNENVLIADFLMQQKEKEQNDEEVANEEEEEIQQDKIDDDTESNKISKKNNIFLMNQLNLYANLCLNRNYNSCNFFQEIFPLKTLIEHIENESIKNEYIKAAFLKLVHYIYLDKEPRTIQVKPNYIRVVELDLDYALNDVFNVERKRMASLTQRDPAQQVDIELQPLQLTPSASKKLQSQFNQDTPQGNKLDGNFNSSIYLQEQSEINSLKKLKTDLLDFLLKKEDLLKKVDSETQNKIFNVMTLESVKILKMMLKFGIFNSEDINTEKFKKKTVTTFIPSKLANAFKSKEEPKPKTEIEKLVDICVKILEYDQFYQETLQQQQIIRRTEEIKKNKDNPLNLKFLSGGMDFIGQGFGSVKGLLDLAIGNGDKDDKKSDNNKKKQVKTMDIGADVVTDPLFKKVQGLKKVLFKYTNKTYLSKADMKKDQEEDYETEIKIQICQIFQELLNIQQDFYLDNTISFFRKNFKNIRSKNQSNLKLTSLLPNEPLEVGTEYSPENDFENHTEKEPPKTFDAILERSFMETLLISFYFAENSVLSNEIMNLIRRTCKQKHELISNIQKIELLLTPENKRSYKILSQLVSKLKNLIQNSQIWLQITESKESELKMEQTLLILEELITELKFEQYQSSDEVQQQMKTSQSIFKHILGDETIIQLIERAFILFHSKKEAFYSNSINKNEKVSRIIQMVNRCFQVLILFCKNNPQHQEIYFHKIFKHLAQFKEYNFGHIPLLYEIVSGNVLICSQLKIEDLQDIADFIVEHGRYSCFLHFFEVILQTISKKDDKQSKTIQALVMKILFDDNISQSINVNIKQFLN